MFRLPGGWYLTPTRHLLAGQGRRERPARRPPGPGGVDLTGSRATLSGGERKKNNNKDVSRVINSSCCLSWDGALSPSSSSGFCAARTKGGARPQLHVGAGGPEATVPPKSRGRVRVAGKGKGGWLITQDPSPPWAARWAGLGAGPTCLPTHSRGCEIGGVATQLLRLRQGGGQCRPRAQHMAGPEGHWLALSSAVRGAVGGRSWPRGACSHPFSPGQPRRRLLAPPCRKGQEPILSFSFSLFGFLEQNRLSVFLL